MTWVKHDDGFSQSRKVFSLTDKAYRLHFCGLEFCSRNTTDGTIKHDEIAIVAATAKAGAGARLARLLSELTEASLWRETQSGYEINDYLEYNPSAEEVKEQRKRNADRQRRHRQARNAVDNALRNGVTNGVSNAAPSQPNPTQRGLALLENPPKDVTHAREGTTPDIDKLARTCGGDTETRRMINRTVNAWASTPAEIGAALEACRGSGVRNRRRVALSELKRLGEQRAASDEPDGVNARAADGGPA